MCIFITFSVIYFSKHTQVIVWKLKQLRVCKSLFIYNWKFFQIGVNPLISNYCTSTHMITYKTTMNSHITRPAPQFCHVQYINCLFLHMYCSSLIFNNDDKFKHLCSLLQSTTSVYIYYSACLVLQNVLTFSCSFQSS